MDAGRTQRLVEKIHTACEHLESVRLMEVCGTHTVSLFRSGVKSLLPECIKLISGPGCPVCVTSQGYIDAACELAQRDDVTICTYGDMVRVPGRSGSLELQRAGGAKIVVVYSARDALKFAREHPDRKVVFLAIGFETTTPATAGMILEARRLGVGNLFALAAHKLVVPVMEAMLSAGEVPLDGFLCPGHVSVIIGCDAYRDVAGKYGKPCVIAGFEPANMLEGILGLVRQVAEGRSEVENVYPQAVSTRGNPVAAQWVGQVFETSPAIWRAMGEIPSSGLDFRPEYRRFDALEQFDVKTGPDYEPAGCLCGQVIQGKADPSQCTLFAKSCTPVQPVGPCMVSSEGACAAWYKYNRAQS